MHSHSAQTHPCLIHQAPPPPLPTKKKSQQFSGFLGVILPAKQTSATDEVRNFVGKYSIIPLWLY